MTDLNFIFQHSSMWPVTLVTLAVLIVVWWTYRRTYPPLPGGYRLLLAGLRTLAVVLTGMLVFEPLLVISGEQARPERVAVLVDRSASMLLPRSASAGDTTSRLAAARAVLEAISSSGDSAVKKFAFGRNMVRLDSAGALNANGAEDRTDLAGALEKLLGSPGPAWDRVVVVGDGRVNTGGDPLDVIPDSGLRVDAVLLGEAPPPGEISLAAVEQTAPAYEDGDVELELTLARSAGPDGQAGASGPATVDISLDGRKVAERRVELSGSGQGMVSSRLSFRSPAAGGYWLEASLRSSGGEWTALDNHRLLRLNVRKSKRTFLLISNSPDWDLTFAAKALSANEDWRVETFLVLGGQDGPLNIRRSDGSSGFGPGKLPSGDELGEAALLLLHGNLNNFSHAFLGRVAGRIAAGGFALVLWPAGPFDPRALPPELSAVLPLAPGAGAVAPVDAPQIPSKLIISGRYSVLNALGSGVVDGLPPVNTIYRGLQLSRQAEVLARAGSRGPLAGEGPSVLAVVPAGGVRGALVAAQGLWRWHMQRQTGSPEEAAFYTRFWTALAEWLTSAGKMSPLTLEPEREVFGRGEPLRLNGSVSLDKGAGPVAVSVSLWRTDSTGEADTLAVRTVEASGSGEGFALDFGSLPPGRYFYWAAAPAGTDTLTAGGTVAVEEYSPEFSEPAPDSSVLAALAARSGGKMVRSGQETGGLEQASAITEQVSSSTDLAHTSWIYWLLVALLAAEWALRRRKALS